MRLSLNKIFRLGVVLAIITLLLLPGNICLAIADPDTMTVNSVEAYQDAVETGDQLYIVTFTLDYTAPPTEAADEAFLIRFLDNSVEIAAVTPYAYYNDGYSDGAITFYFDADDPDLPTWNQNDITIQITGNPSLSLPVAVADRSAPEGVNMRPILRNSRPR